MLMCARECCHRANGRNGWKAVIRWSARPRDYLSESSPVRTFGFHEKAVRRSCTPTGSQTHRLKSEWNCRTAPRWVESGRSEQWYCPIISVSGVVSGGVYAFCPVVADRCSGPLDPASGALHPSSLSPDLRHHVHRVHNGRFCVCPCLGDLAASIVKVTPSSRRHSGGRCSDPVRGCLSRQRKRFTVTSVNFRN